MSNTSVRRSENCFMPPKKSVWRINKAQSGDPVTQHSVPANLNTLEIVPLSESNFKPVDNIQTYSTVERMAITNPPYGDAPLDFSLKTRNSAKSSPGTVNHGMKQLGNSGLMVGHTIKQEPSPVFPGMFNGSNSPPATTMGNRSPVSKDISQVYHPLVTSSCRENDSLERDSSQSSDPDTSPTGNGLNGLGGKALRNNSPEAVRQNSPVSQTSILEGMLRGQKTNGLPNNMQSFPAGLGLLESQIMGSPSPPMAVAGPVMHQGHSFLPFTVPPYFGYGYVDQPYPFMPNYMYKPLECNVVGAPSARKSKRKTNPLTDSLKSCSVDDLRNKLISIKSENSFIPSSECSASLRPSCSPKREPCENSSNSSSPGYVQNAINHSDFNGKSSAAINRNNTNEINGAITQETNGASTVASSQSEVSETNITSVNTSENAAHLNSHETDHKSGEVNHSETNGTNVTPCADDSSLVSSAIEEACDGDRKRKPIPDYKKDPMYKMKRAKNNLAARRSRETRRMKEELIRQTASALEAKNKLLARDYSALKYSYDEFQVRYITLAKEYESVKIHESVLLERIKQKRCGQCGATLPIVVS